MTGSHQGAARIMGSLRRIDDRRGAIRMEDVYDTTIDDLWTALTERHRLARWLVAVDGDLRPGGQVHARFTSSWEGPGRIDVCDAPHKLTVTMSPGASDETLIEASLFPEGDGTRLVIEERGIPLGEIAAHGAGWQVHVEDLASHLAGREPEQWRDRWVAMTPAYQDLAGELA